MVLVFWPRQRLGWTSPKFSSTVTLPFSDVRTDQSPPAAEFRDFRARGHAVPMQPGLKFTTLAFTFESVPSQ
jgi:hypothetical protein